MQLYLKFVYPSFCEIFLYVKDNFFAKYWKKKIYIYNLQFRLTCCNHVPDVCVMCATFLSSTQSLCSELNTYSYLLCAAAVMILSVKNIHGRYLVYTVSYKLKNNLLCLNPLIILTDGSQADNEMAVICFIFCNFSTYYYFTVIIF